MAKPPSASSRNVEQYRALHAADENYGKSSRKVIDLIEQAIKTLRRENPDVSVGSILDFGCGKSQTAPRIGAALGMQAYEYDPAIPGKDRLPVTTADIVINTDVLEHLDLAEVDVLLADIRQASDKAFFHIATSPAGKSLPNGENAHATVKPDTWWADKLRAHFDVVTALPAEPNRASFVTWEISQSGLKKIEVAYALKRKRYGAALRRFFG